MTSLSGRLTLFALRHRHLFRLSLKKETIDWDTSIPALRQQHEKMNRLIARPPAGVEVTPLTAGGLAAEWIVPAGGDNEKLILFMHGGGYVSGSIDDHRSLVAKVVRAAGVGALLFDYRLAPEHPFPAALEDALTAYRWLLESGRSPADIVLMGDSAGGGLVLATLLALRDQGTPLPAAAVALSPWTDLTCSGESYTSKAKVCLSPAGSWTVFGSYYVGDNDPATPWISPLYGELAGLPPLLIFVGQDEVLRDDSIVFARRARAAGVDVTLTVGEGMVHCYPLLAPLFPEARQAMDELCVFVRRQLELDPAF